MRQSNRLGSLGALAVTALFLGACAVQPTVTGTVPRQPSVQPQAESPPPSAEMPLQFADTPPVAEEPAVPRIDPMADVAGDKPLPPLVGVLERIDCKSGSEDLHARIAFEARGGRVANFAYYSKWKPRTCALDFSRASPGTKWRLTPDGATRVHTPEGRFLIRTQKDSYVFEFEQVQRGRFCGMPGDINGTMIVKRNLRTPDCTANGVMDTKDPYLEALYQGKLK